MESKFDRYFNQHLKQYLKYPENFSFKFRPDYIVLVPSQPSKLLEAIKSDVNLDKNLTAELKKVLNVSDVELRSSGGNIIIYRSNTFKISDIVDPGVYANIASSLSSEKLQAFCNSTPQFSQICRDDNFWIQLIKEKFPQWYHFTKNRYEWKQVYLGLLYLSEENISFNNIFKHEKIRRDYPNFKHENEVYEKLLKDYSETLKYLLQEDFITLNYDQLENMSSNIDDIEIIRLILEKVKVDGIFLFNTFVYNIGHPETMKLLLNYRGVDEGGEELKIEPEDLYENIHPDEIYARDPEIDLESYKVLRDISGWDAEMILHELASLNPTSKEMLDFFMERLSEVSITPMDILDWYTEVADYVNPKILERVWDKFKNLFDARDIEEFRKRISKYSDEDKDLLLRIIK